MKRHEFWRAQYRRNRYLEHLDDAELHARGRELLNVNIVLTDEGKIAPLDIAAHGSEAIERFTHYVDECAMRAVPWTMGNDSEALKKVVPNLVCEIGLRAASAISEFKTRQTGKLFKFGKRRRLESLIESGNLRIQPASSFSDPRHNSAVKDDEMGRRFNLGIKREQLAEVFKANGWPEIALERDRFEIQINHYTDYWLTCFCQLPAPRMAVDFDADSMVAVRDVHEFRRRLRKAVRDTTDYHQMLDGEVEYFDPYMPNCDIRKIPFIKPFGYYYQREYRYVWLPKTPSKKLDHLDVTMGSIADIAELISW